MILIADSGSTKTDWRLIINNSVKEFSTIGLNPFFVSYNEIIEAISKSDLNTLRNEIKTIYFFGAGCSIQQNCELITNSLLAVFVNANVNVDSDMSGACKALFGDDTGIAAILGTGSNSAFYKNGNIVYSQPSLGYILGDEGSGSYLGKKLIAKYLNNELPIELANEFNKQFSLGNKDILNSVYKEAFPNRYLASFSVFLYQYIKHEYIAKMVKNGLEDFFIRNLIKYPEIKKYPVRFTGSIAFYFSEIIYKLADKYSITIDKIEKQPINALVKRYRGNSPNFVKLQ